MFKGLSNGRKAVTLHIDCDIIVRKTVKTNGYGACIKYLYTLSSKCQLYE